MHLISFALLFIFKMVTASRPECKIMATSRFDKKNGIDLSFVVVDL